MPPIKSVSLVVMAAFYVLAGVLHFVKRDFYVAIVPPALPNPVAVVLVSGVVEIVLGLALLVPSLRVAAAWGIVVLLLAVFPANVYAAVARIPGAGGYPRLPFQGVFLLWAWWHTR